MCDNFRPIRDLEIAMKDNKIIKYVQPENQVNDNIFYERCSKVKTNKMNNKWSEYQTSIYKFQNNDRPETQFRNVIDVNNELVRNPTRSCIFL
jgi:hypothetical protein